MKGHRRGLGYGGRGPTAATLAKANPAGPEAHGMTRGLILLNIRRGAEYRPVLKNEKKDPDVVEAAKILHMHAAGHN